MGSWLSTETGGGFRVTRARIKWERDEWYWDMNWNHHRLEGRLLRFLFSCSLWPFFLLLLSLHLLNTTLSFCSLIIPNFYSFFNGVTSIFIYHSQPLVHIVGIIKPAFDCVPSCIVQKKMQTGGFKQATDYPYHFGSPSKAFVIIWILEGISCGEGDSKEAWLEIVCSVPARRIVSIKHFHSHGWWVSLLQNFVAWIWILMNHLLATTSLFSILTLSPYFRPFFLFLFLSS